MYLFPLLSGLCNVSRPPQGHTTDFDRDDNWALGQRPPMAREVAAGVRGLPRETVMLLPDGTHATTVVVPVRSCPPFPPRVLTPPRMPHRPPPLASILAIAAHLFPALAPALAALAPALAAHRPAARRS